MASRHRYKGMSTHANFDTAAGQPMIYQVRIQGHLSGQWSGWFGGLTITQEDNGETLFTGPVVDQAALHGVLNKLRDLALSIIPVQSL